MRTQTIICPNCNSLQVGEITFDEGMPFPSYVHECSDCKYLIMESEWCKVKTLHLNLNRKWFNLIKSGEKKEEYRELKEHWFRQLLQCYQDIRDGKPKYECKKAACHSCLSRASGGRFKKFETITFSNGYAKNRPQFEIELKGIQIGIGKTEWGAEAGKKYFVLELGKIIDHE